MNTVPRGFGLGGFPLKDYIMNDTKHAGGRKRTGQLIWRKSGWYARFWTVVDGEEVRVSRPLGTENKAVARRKMARLMAGEDPAAAKR